MLRTARSRDMPASAVRNRISYLQELAVFDWFSQCARIVDQVCEVQKTLVDDIFDQLQSGGVSDKTVDTSTEYIRNLYHCAATNPGRMVEIQINYWQNQLKLCNNLVLKLVG